MFEYVLGGVFVSAFERWYLFWPGALLALYGIAWLRADARARDAVAYSRWWPRRSDASTASRATAYRAGGGPRLRRASFALLAVAPLLLVARILTTPTMAVNWFDIDGFENWPKWFTTDLVVLAPWIQVGAAALVVVVRRGTRRASACLAAGTVLMLVAFTESLLAHPGTMAELAFSEL